MSGGIWCTLRCEVRCRQKKICLTVRGIRCHRDSWWGKRWERRWECLRCVRQILWRRWGWWDDAHGIGWGFGVANLLIDFWLCQSDVQSSEILWWMERVRLNAGEVGCWFYGGVDVFVPSYVAMAGDPYESYSDRDGGQGEREGMNTIDERVGRRCIGDGWQRRKEI